jgi:sugar transferase (PEP-CTERM/EpsH1 system associated)
MKIFVLVSRVPWPLEKGDKLRAYHQVRELSKQHEIMLCCLSDQKIDPQALNHLRTFCTHVEVVRLHKWRIAIRMVLGLFSSRPLQVHYFFQRAAARMVDTHIQAFSPDHIYCQLIRCSEYVKNIHHVPKTLDYMDAFNKGMERLAEQSGPILRMLWRMEARRLVRYENLIFDYFDHHTIISKQDQQLIYHPKRQTIAVIPNGVDTAFFEPQTSEKQYDVVFTGNMSYPPNIDTAELLAHEVMPVVWRTHPSATLLIAGASPHPRVSALAKNERVTVSGWLDDIRTAYRQGKVFAAPLRIGTGLQNKLLEAMSMELPCITTALANNALGAMPHREILVEESTEAMGKQIAHLLNSPEEAAELAKNGREFVLQHFAWTTAVQKLTNLMLSKRNSVL